MLRLIGFEVQYLVFLWEYEPERWQTPDIASLKRQTEDTSLHEPRHTHRFEHLGLDIDICRLQRGITNLLESSLTAPTILRAAVGSTC